MTETVDTGNNAELGHGVVKQESLSWTINAQAGYEVQGKTFCLISYDDAIRHSASTSERCSFYAAGEHFGCIFDNE